MVNLYLFIAVFMLTVLNHHACLAAQTLHLSSWKENILINFSWGSRLRIPQLGEL